jgi:hypothetical protein
MRHLYVARDLLDHPVIDAKGVPCGMVDDVELEQGADHALAVTAILIGPGIAQKRLWRSFGWIVSRLAGSGRTRIPCAAIARFGPIIHLAESAESLGLDRAERRWRRWLERLPAA